MALINHADMAIARTSIQRERVDLYDRQIAAHTTIERKGAANPYTSVNGHMFSCMNKAGDVGIRLLRQDREEFLEKYESQLLVSYNTVMKEYVVVPDSVLNDYELFQSYLNRSYEYVTSLKPKPTSRKSKK